MRVHSLKQRHIRVNLQLCSDYMKNEQKKRFIQFLIKQCNISQKSTHIKQNGVQLGSPHKEHNYIKGCSHSGFCLSYNSKGAKLRVPRFSLKLVKRK